MADLLPSNSVSMSSLMANIQRVKENPFAVIQYHFDYLNEVTDGKVTIVDPTNPFVALMECSAVNTAINIGETKTALRYQYASLAQTPDELYSHMCDKDFIDRFATPSSTTFTFVFLFSDIANKLVYDPSEDCYKGIIPRDTSVTVDNITFTMQYPIVFRKFHDGSIKVMYDASIDSPIDALTSNVMEPVLRNDKDNVTWLFLDVPMRQFKINTTYFPIQRSIPFNETLVFEREFFYARVYQRNDKTNNQWKEIKTTHTDQVFDIADPTAVLKVFGQNLTVFIPPVYVTTELITGELRIDLYTTNGYLNLNLSTYLPTAYDTRLNVIDTVRDTSDYTNIMTQLTYYVFNKNLVNGGKGWISFDKLRERVIMNAMGDRKIPITNVNLQAEVEDIGFSLVKNIDTVTNRVFLASQKLPTPLAKTLNTAANMGIATLISSVTDLVNNAFVYSNGPRVTLSSKNLYRNINGQVSILTPQEIDALLLLPRSELTALVNQRQYLYTPFYYLLDGSKNEFEIRVYNLDYPKASNLGFESQNQTLQLQVNTSKYFLTKVPSGYELTLVTRSGNHYKNLPDSSVQVQLAFYSKNESSLTYFNGTQTGLTSDGERIFTFTLMTDYDVDEDGYLSITNGRMHTNEYLRTWVKLSDQFHIFHTTNSITNDFKPDESNKLIGSFILPESAACVTYEKLDIELGKSLKHLWTRSRSIPTGLTYETYPEDIPMYYSEDVYGTDPITGSIFKVTPTGELEYIILHRRGDPVLDNDGNQVYIHRKGDVKLVDGQPIHSSQLSVAKEFDILFIDGKYWFCDDRSFVDYRDEINATLVTWITESLTDINNRLLEQSRLYFYPKTTLGMVRVLPTALTPTYINAEQSLVLDLYVRDTVYKDLTLRNTLKSAAIKLLDSRITEKTIIIDDLQEELKAIFKESVTSLRLSSLGGSENYNMLVVVDDHTRLCLKKSLVALQDGTLIVEEDVDVRFHNIDRPI